MISRRTFLRGAGLTAVVTGGAVAGVETGVIPGRNRIHHALGLTGEDGVVPDVEPGRMLSGEFDSAAMKGAKTGWAVSLPPGHEPAGLRPLVVLHGRGSSHRDAFKRSSLAMDRYLAAAVATGAAPFAVASLDGGDHSYWHKRADGTDAMALVVDEFLPLLAAQGLALDRVAFGGWSMGGFGALLIASELGPTRVASAVASSPALWHQAGDSASGAFDDAADFAQHSIFGRLDKLSGIPVRVDCGRDDGFLHASEDLVAALRPQPPHSFPAGGHDYGFWRRVMPTQLEFTSVNLSQ